MRATLTADSLNAFLRLVLSLRQRWSSRERGRVDPWFRGLEDASFDLRPGVYRYKYADEDDFEVNSRATRLADVD